jgi:hypothetical protein
MSRAEPLLSAHARAVEPPVAAATRRLDTRARILAVAKVLALVAGLALALTIGLCTASAQDACGGLLQPPCPTPSTPTASTPTSTTPSSTTPTNPAPTLPAAPLSQARYRAIDAILAASVPLDHSYARAPRRAYRRSCKTLDRRDPLLRSFRTWCLVAADIYDSQAAAAACRTKSCFIASLDTGATLTARFRTEFIALDRVIDTQVVNVGCRDALRAPPGELARYQQLVSALRGYASALRSGSQTAIKKASNHLNAVGSRRGVRSNRTELREMEHACS